MLIESLRDLWNDLDRLDKQIADIERRLQTWMIEDKACKAIAAILGVGYACPACGRSLLAATSLRRLRARTGIDAAGLDRLRAWNDYFFRYMRLLGHFAIRYPISSPRFIRCLAAAR